MMGVYGPLGDLRLLRHADRLERRDRARARAALRRRARRRGSCTATTRSSAQLQRERPDASYRDVLTVALARLAEREGLPLARPTSRRARAVAAGLGAVSRGAGGARGRARARLEARDPLEHRPRLHRGLARADRRAVRARDRRVGDRLVQAGAPSTGRRSRSRAGAARARTCTSARASSTTSRRRSSSGCRPSGSTGSARTPEPQPDVELHSLTGLGAALDSLAP